MPCGCAASIAAAHRPRQTFGTPHGRPVNPDQQHVSVALDGNRIGQHPSPRRPEAGGRPDCTGCRRRNGCGWRLPHVTPCSSAAGQSCDGARVFFSLESSRLLGVPWAQIILIWTAWTPASRAGRGRPRTGRRQDHRPHAWAGCARELLRPRAAPQPRLSVLRLRRARARGWRARRRRCAAGRGSSPRRHGA
jgi:hypothetical protein